MLLSSPTGPSLLRKLRSWQRLSGWMASGISAAVSIYSSACNLGWKPLRSGSSAGKAFRKWKNLVFSSNLKEYRVGVKARLAIPLRLLC
ncbi:hypothetical protein AAC387_Pa05g0470 [Persea americana]